MFFSSKCFKNKQPISGLSYCDCKWLRPGYRKLLSSQRGVINKMKKLALSYRATPYKFSRPKIEQRSLFCFIRFVFHWVIANRRAVLHLVTQIQWFLVILFTHARTCQKDQPQQKMLTSFVNTATGGFWKNRWSSAVCRKILPSP